MTFKIIRFDAHDRLLAKARAYISAPDEMMQAPGEAITLLFKAFKVADEELKLKIVLMLGTLARPQVIWPLYKLMHDDQESESIRHAAAIQLSVIGEILENPKPLVQQLKQDLRSENAFTRACSAFALGWEGNRAAVFALIEKLYDDDPEVQQAAVNSLANLNDERLFDLLVERLQNGTREQKRSILYNLYRFTARKSEVIRIYKSYILGCDHSLAYDALAIFETIADPISNLVIYRQCLKNADPRLRELSLARLLATRSPRLAILEPDVGPLIKDPDPRVRQAAIRLYNYIRPSIILS
ncbi:MAG: HEAT repeat domain-containing protein [Desulfosarcinaceae bacterium]